tara:strand:- start:620 stop:820 length:201 start_codon:yes stop_codon:yes gene_type:complete
VSDKTVMVDLGKIRARVDLVSEIDDLEHGMLLRDYIVMDVVALISEVKRLREELSLEKSKQWRSAR